MKVTVSESKGLKTNLNVLVKKQEIDKKIEERVIELQKTVNIKGFRPGKAPVDLLKKQFAQALYGEVLEKILQDNTYQALNDNKIKPVSQPKIEIKSSGEDKDLEYTISVEKTPEIKKIELEKITLTDYKLKIEKKDLEERINLLAEGQKKYVNKKEGECSVKGDLVVFDFEATVNSKPFEGNKGQKVQIILGKELFIKGFDEQLLTCKSGDKKDVKINLPENYPNKELANKTAIFNCKILEVKKSESVVVDDQFAKNLGAKDLNDLKILLEKQLSKEQSSITETIVRKEILDYLDENCKFELPEDLVKNEQEIVKHSFIHEKAHKDEPHDDHKHGHDHSDIKLTKEEEDDILDISKIEAGVVQLNYNNVNINNLLDSICAFYYPIAKKNNLIFTCVKGLADSDSFIKIDKTKLHQILTNLLSNAFKFTDKGSVEIGYHIKKNELQFLYSKQ